jgi:antitoxin YefM
MSEPVTISQFRQHAGPLFTGAVGGHTPLVIRRGGKDLGLLVGRDEAWALLGDRTFNPQVMHSSKGSVSIWLPELEVYGQGPTYALAKADLLEEIRVYIEEYLADAEEYLRAPNRAGHLPHIVKAHLADLRDELESVIFPGPPDPPAKTRNSTRAPRAQ